MYVEDCFNVKICGKGVEMAKGSKGQGNPYVDAQCIHSQYN